MDNHSFALRQHLVLGLTSLLAFGLIAGSARAVQPLVVPRSPDVPPLIARNYDGDLDRDRIEDRLISKARAAETAHSRAATAAEQAATQAELNALVDVELIFDRQITQKQLTDFLAQGGEVTHLYEAVSYGWNGRLPLGKVTALTALMGDSLVQVEEVRPAELYLDNATRTGRVRPVWAAGFAGNASGFDGDSNITIGIVDSGVDESHTDLNGRRAFWHDYSADGSANPVDVVQHGSHVMGIALGTGAAAGAATGSLLFTDSGNLTGVGNGSFFPSPFNLPATPSVTVNIVSTWQGGGSTTLYLVYHTRGTSGGWTIQGAGVTGTSPLTLNLTFTPSTTRVYSAALTSNGSMSGYATTVAASGFAAIGDGFNKLRGVAPGCNWAGAKAFTTSGSGSSATISAGIDGLVANRIANNIKVMNISLGITGDPGISTSQRQKVNSAVNNGIVMVCAAGNDGLKATALQREMDDPGRAALALTVAAADDNNQLTDYTSSGFSSPGSTAGVEEDYKPDLMAPGGSVNYYSSILSVDSNSGDGTAFADQRTNDYYNIQGTSMASPFVAGSAALVIDALQQAGTNWSFSSSQHPRLVKMLLCATATEANANREGSANNPTLQRNAAGPSGFPVGKDPYEGFGMINPDAAIEAAIMRYTNGTAATAALGGTVNDRRAWARTVSLPGGTSFSVTLNVPAGGDFDLYLYSRTPGAYGTPVLLASSAKVGNGVAESFTNTPATSTNVLLVVKRVSGSGSFTLLPGGLVTADFTGSPTSGLAPLTVVFNNTSSGATSYAWNFGDGNTSTNISPSHTYTNAGSYSITLVAVGSGVTNSFTRNNYIGVTNPAPLLAGFTATPTNGAAPLVVNFSNLSTGATNYLWTFGNGQSSALVNPTINFTAGVYTVTLAAIGPAGTNVLTRPSYIVVTNAPPLVTAQPQNQSVNLGQNATFSVTASGTPPLQYQWRHWGTNLPGATSSILNIINAQVGDAGDYSVVVSSPFGSATSALATLSVILVPGVIPISGSPYAQNFDVMGSGGTTTPFGWYVGSGAGAISSTNVTVSNGAVNDAANYNFGANGSSDRALGSLAANSAVRDTEVRFINVSDFDLTALTLSYTGEQWRVGGNGAANNDLVLQYSSDGVNFVALGAAFNFNTPVDSAPPGALDGNAAPNRVTSIGGTYAPASPITSGQVFYLRWVDEDNSSQDHGLAVDDFAISFTLAVPSPEADFTADTTSGVAPLAVQFANLSAHATGYFWDFGDGRTSSLANPSNLYSNTGSFTVTLAAINPIGTNVLTRTNFITVTNHPPVVADFTADLTGGLAPLTVVFTNLSANATDFAWSFGDGNTSTEANPSYTYLNTGSYAVTLTATGPGGTNVLTRADYILVTNIPPLLVMGSDALDFGTVFTGSVAQASLVISNAGGSALSATATLTPAPFFLLDAASNAVGNLSFALPANAETNLVVQFAPGTPGVFTNLSVIFSDGGTATNSLAGRALGTPVIFNLAFHPPEFTFAFATVPGLNYQVQFKDSLEDVFWQALPAIVGDGAIHTITNVVTTPAQRFYRLSIE